MKKKYSKLEFVKQNSLIDPGAAMISGLSSSFHKSALIDFLNSSQIDRIENEIILHGRKNNQAWFAPAVGVIPGNEWKLPQIFINALILTGNDIGPLFYLKTDNLGKTWSNPVLCQNWFKVPYNDHVFGAPSLGFFYHTKSKRFFAVGYLYFVQDQGSNTNYKNERHYRPPDLKSSIVYSLWDPVRADFKPWKRMEVPENLDLGLFSHGQFHEKDDGTILFPGFYRGPLKKAGYPQTGGVTTLRCKFDGFELQYIEHGSIHSVEEARGLAEPSLVYCGGRYFMTIRHDLRGYVTTSYDGLHFEELKTWHFDNGNELGNYNTQQKWLKHNNTLYLVYNRRSELNNGVFRSRAPLFMAEVDTDRLVIRKDTERIVFPERGARMGNFNVANITENESWIITGEWLQGIFPHSKEGERFWSNASTYNYIQYIGDLLLARIHWKT